MLKKFFNFIMWGDSRGKKYQFVKSKGTHIYLIRDMVTDAGKVGIAVNPRKRMKQLQTGNPHELRLWIVSPPMRREDALAREAEYHHEMTADGSHIGGEWFDFEGWDQSPPDLRGLK